VDEWEISDQDSCSDHIIRYVIRQDKGNKSEFYFHDTRYIVQKCNIEKFQVNLSRLAATIICKIDKQGETEGMEELYSTLCTHALMENYVEKLIEEFYEVLILACRESFRTQRAAERIRSNTSVPWWTDELTILRKRLNALRRRYQKTRNNEDLRQQRKAQYQEGKARYALTIKKEKISSWKEYCNLTSFWSG